MIVSKQGLFPTGWQEVRQPLYRKMLERGMLFAITDELPA